MARSYRKPGSRNTTSTNPAVDLLVDTLFKRQGAKMNKPKLSIQEKRELKNLLMNLQENVDTLTKSVKK